ncbi:DUF3784 domain-containing protein [Streptomyces sp. NPDC059918]|uniref:DUF3784 domain-containing protein n=1 Tax=unclassified Streptomyces TaxID=2593676 RepID=UPI0036526101
MSDEPIVVVCPPDRRGLREVRIRGELADRVWSAKELRALLDQSGLADMAADDPAVEWRGAGPDVWPDRVARRFAAGGLLAAGLFGCMALLICVGQVDAFGSPFFANRLTGFLLLAGGVVQGIAAFAAMDFEGKRRWPYSSALIIAGVLIALLSNGLFLALWATETEYRTPLLPVFVVLILWTVWAIWYLVQQRVWRGVPHPKSIALGFIITTALTAVNLLNTSWYEPSVTPVDVTTSATFGKATIEDDFVRVPVTFKVKNTGKVPVYVPVSTFWVVGRHIEPTQEDLAEETWKRELEKAQDFDLFAKPPRSTMISTGEIVGAGSYVNAGDAFEKKKLITLPKSAPYTALTAGTEIRALRKDRATLPSGLKPDGFSWNPTEGRPRTCADPPCNAFVFYTGYIENSNNMINVTRMPRYLHARWIMHPDAANSEIGAGVRPKHPAQVSSSDWEDEETYGIERIMGGGDLVPFHPLVAEAAKASQ